MIDVGFRGHAVALTHTHRGVIPDWTLDGEPKRQLDLEVRLDRDGNKALYFEFMSLSDLHLGTKHSRAKRTSHMLEHTIAKIMRLGGDEVDGIYLSKKRKWHWPEWHRQVLGHILRKADEGADVAKLSSNHDFELRGKKIQHKNGEQGWHRKLVGKVLFGIRIVDEIFHTDPLGRRFKQVHGDVYDDVVFGQKKGFWYGVGDALHEPLANFDTWLQNWPKFDCFSVAAWGKRVTKTIINDFMGVNREITRIVEADPSIDGHIGSHSHMGDIQKTPAGKLLFNTGCCTEHVQALVHDRHGSWGLITWHKDRLDILEESGQRRTVFWKDIGLESFQKEPEMIEDASTQKADRLIRLIFRMWPPKERLEFFKKLQWPERMKATFEMPLTIPARIRASGKAVGVRIPHYEGAALG